MDIFKMNEVAALSAHPGEIILILIVSSLLGWVIAWTYFRTHRGFSYSQSFANTLILLTVITTLIILVIGDNIARAIGIFGAFSIIRFRTAVKEARDTAFVFFCLAVGLALGTGSFILGIIGTGFIVGLIFALHMGNFAGPKPFDYVLSFSLDTNQDDQPFNAIFDQYLSAQQLLNVKADKNKNVMKFNFSITLKKNRSLNEFLQQLKDIKGIEQVNAVSSKNDLVF